MKEAELGRRMNMKERLYLSPLERYRRFHLFPWDLVVSVVLVVMTTCQVVLVVQTSYMYSYSQLLQWNRLFLNRDVGVMEAAPDTGITNSYTIYSPGELVTYVHALIDVPIL